MGSIDYKQEINVISPNLDWIIPYNIGYYKYPINEQVCLMVN